MKSQFGSIFAHSGINAKGVMAEGVRVVGFMGGVCLCRKSGVSRVWVVSEMKVMMARIMRVGGHNVVASIDEGDRDG